MASTHSRSTRGAAAEAITYRAAESESDRSAVIKGEFTSDTVFEVVRSEYGFTLRPVPLDPPVHKVFPDDEPESDEVPGDSGDERRFVALDGDRVCGYVDTAYEPWNRRLTIVDIEVAGPYQGRGIGRTLMHHAVERAGSAAPGTYGWRSRTSTARPSALTSGWDSASAAWTRRCTAAPRPRARRRCT